MDMQLLVQSVAVDRVLGGYRKDASYYEPSNWKTFLYNFDQKRFNQYYNDYNRAVAQMGEEYRRIPEVEITEEDRSIAEKVHETLQSKMMFKSIAGTLGDFEQAVFRILEGGKIERKSEHSMVLIMPKLYRDYIEQEQLESRVYGRTQLVKDRKIEGSAVWLHKRTNKDYGYDSFYGLLDDEYPVTCYVGHDKHWTFELNQPTDIKGRVADIRYLNGTAYTRLNYIKKLDK